MTDSSKTRIPSESSLPLFVQVGFAGSRRLYDPKAHPRVDPEAFDGEVQRFMTKRLRALPTELGQSTRRMFCGLSSLAVGADMNFARSCRELDWSQRVLLPQRRDEFLSAIGSSGVPDFSEEERRDAIELLASPHVIQAAVVSESEDRHTRFQDVSLELVRICDVVVCLIDASGADKPGGTLELIKEARKRDVPLLEVRVAVGANDLPIFTEEWRGREDFVAPAMPKEFEDFHAELAGIPRIDEYCEPLKSFASLAAKGRQTLFKTAAVVIIGTHVLATGCAAVALKMHGAAALPWILGAELALLAVGFGFHHHLHRSHAGRIWAMTRLVAEIARSALALRGVPGRLKHLYDLPLPPSLGPLIRTLDLLHLRDVSRRAEAPVHERCGAYVNNRLLDPKRGQIPYYGEKSRTADRWLSITRRAFLAGSGLAIIATLGKLLLVLRVIPSSTEACAAWEAVLGVLAVALPVVAVAALSLAASFDVEARAQTYRDMSIFLAKQRDLLDKASSERGFIKLAMESESRLLGETASWFHRRSFTGVA